MRTRKKKTGHRDGGDSLPLVAELESSGIAEQMSSSRVHPTVRGSAALLEEKRKRRKSN